MAHVSVAVEYGLHCLLFLVGGPENGGTASARDVAELQGVSPEYVAKIFTRLQKAGLVVASEGIDGGFGLARSAAEISVLDVVDAIDGRKPLFDCQNIRLQNAVFEGKPPAWAGRGVCAIHAVMLDAEKKMRDALAAQSLAAIAGRFVKVAPPEFGEAVVTWLTVRKQGRRVAVKPKGKTRQK